MSSPAAAKDDTGPSAAQDDNDTGPSAAQVETHDDEDHNPSKQLRSSKKKQKRKSVQNSEARKLARKVCGMAPHGIHAASRWFQPCVRA